KPRLAEAIPQPDPGREKKHLSLTSDIPSHNDPPKGCPLQPRCPVAKTECAESKPPLKPVDAEDTSSKHQVACWLY
ncbi:MAG TPA: hypothetical protein DDW68_01450, partial [Verrucomicrobiales bacterium]|nr:hypothetical protein [Verrucomicrobiales bacterium]